MLLFLSAYLPSIFSNKTEYLREGSRSEEENFLGSNTLIPTLNIGSELITPHFHSSLHLTPLIPTNHITNSQYNLRRPKSNYDPCIPSSNDERKAKNPHFFCNVCNQILELWPMVLHSDEQEVVKWTLASSADFKSLL